MPVEWITPTNGGWYTLHSLDLAHSHFDNFHGVYIIFKILKQLMSVLAKSAED